MTEKEGPRLIVCGGRGFDDAHFLDMVLARIYSVGGISCVIHGDYRGADRLADKWAKERGIPVDPCPADWGKYGKSAGPRRNRFMLTRGPDGVVAFPGGGGTADMMRAAEEAGLPVYEPSRYDLKAAFDFANCIARAIDAVSSSEIHGATTQ